MKSNKSKTENFDLKISCTCGVDNYISTDEPEHEEWSCWSCDDYLVNVVGHKYAHRNAAGEELDRCYRVYALPPVESILAAGESDEGNHECDRLAT